MEFRILGPLEADAGGRPLALGGKRQRAVLAALLLRANQVVSTDRLLDELWGEQPPASAAKALQVHVSRLRKLLPAGLLATQPPGYVLRVGSDELDVLRFQSLLDDARGSGDPEQAARKLREALALFRGPPLADFAYEPFAQTEIARLEELRLAALEERIDADLALARHPELVGELEALVAEHPLRERLRGQLMLALYRSGRQAEALEAYREARRVLDQELGIEPGPTLKELERAILRQEEALAAPEAPKLAPPRPEPPAAPSEIRKLVTVLFCDLVRSTELAEELDAEVFGALLGRYFELAERVLLAHGATLEKFIGDAVLAVFGVPAAHEDDALRAARAALELAAAVGGLDLAVRIGIESGEVVAGDPSAGERFVVGDTVHRAQRLQAAAAAGEVAVGPRARRLLGRTAETEPAGAGFRLLALAAGGADVETPLVGRRCELERLEEVFERAVELRSAQLVTLLGEAGIGKSRLARELRLALAGRSRSLVGRCLPYGEGISFWPLREMLDDVAGDDLGRGISRLLDSVPDAPRIAQLVTGLVGAGDAEAGLPERFWATRRLLTALAGVEPLLLLFEDLHWAEPALLDLLDQLCALVRGVPLLLVCTARPELLESRPGWASAENAVLVRLEPLSEDEAAQLIAASGGDALAEGERRRIAGAAEGNPLYIEQFLALLSEDCSDAALELPPTLQALVAARLDRLGADERTLVEHASVIGRVFERASLAAVAPDALRDALDTHLAGLVRKQLVQPWSPGLPGEEGYRFRHVVIRDAAYRRLTKRARAGLHERFARWLAGIPGDYDEIVGYHLEQACLYLTQLGEPAERRAGLAEEASTWLESAGQSALGRGDLAAAVGFLERGASLLPDCEARVRLDLNACRALVDLGEFVRAEARIEETIAAAERLETRSLAVQAKLERVALRGWISPEGGSDELRREAEAAIPVLEKLRDDLALAHAWRHIAEVHLTAGRFAARSEAIERALAYARAAGDRSEELRLLARLPASAYCGGTPVAEAIRRCELVAEQAAGNLEIQWVVLLYIAALHAMAGSLEEARRVAARSKAIGEELGFTIGRVGAALVGAELELLSGDAEAAERELRPSYELMAARDERGVRPSLAAILAYALFLQGRDEEAERLALESVQVAAGDDVHAQALGRGVRARILARRGSLEQAEGLARESVALAASTDFLDLRATLLAGLAEVLAASGRAAEAAEAAGEALALYERKGNVVSAERTRRLLARLR